MSMSAAFGSSIVLQGLLGVFFVHSIVCPHASASSLQSAHPREARECRGAHHSGTEMEPSVSGVSRPGTTGILTLESPMSLMQTWWNINIEPTRLAMSFGGKKGSTYEHNSSWPWKSSQGLYGQAKPFHFSSQESVPGTGAGLAEAREPDMSERGIARPFWETWASKWSMRGGNFSGLGAATPAALPDTNLNDMEHWHLPANSGTIAADTIDFPLNSANRPVNGWDVALFFATLLVPFVISTVRHFCFVRVHQRKPPAEIVGAFQVPEKRERTNSYYIETSKREDTGRLHQFLTGPRTNDGPQGTILKNLLSGSVIALDCLPEAISFSLIAGVSPLNGIWAGCIMGLCAALVGGRPGMVACSSAATAVVLVEVTKDPQLGVGAMSVVVLVCGAVQALVGSLRLARFVTLIPQPVILGFINGLAVVIACSQVDHFRVQGAGTPFLDRPAMLGMLSTAAVSVAIAWAYPRIPFIGGLLPGSFVAVTIAIVFAVYWSPYPQRTLEQVAGENFFKGGLANLPPWNFPPLEVDWHSKYMWNKAIITGIRMAIVGLVESLITLILVDQITETRGSTTQECFGQSLGNLLSGLFGVQGGCSLIGQTLINVSSGGRGRLSGITMSAGMFFSIVVFAPVVGKIPIAALVGLMLLVAINSFAWGTLGFWRRAAVQWTDGIVIMMVMFVTIFLDLATAVVLGLVVSALMFAWNVSKKVRLEEYVDRVLDTRTFSLRGPLFFGSASDFQLRVDPSVIPQQQVVLDFSTGNVLDSSGSEAIAKVISRLQEGGKHVELIGLNVDAKEFVRHTRDLPMD